MKTLLMYQNQDFDPAGELPPNAPELTQDLDLDTLVNAMALGDPFLADVTRAAVLTSLHDPQAIEYRQHVLADCLEHPAVIRELYDMAVECLEYQKKVYRGWFNPTPDTILQSSLEALQLLLGTLRRLRQIAEEEADDFPSDGFTAFFQMLRTELTDGYFQSVEEHVRRLRLRGGVLVSAQLGKGNRGTNYTLRRPPDTKQGWMERLTGLGRTDYTITISERDESGASALWELRGRGVNLVANAVAQSVDHIVSFFCAMRAELGFYVGCLNLYGQLDGKGEPLCYPIPEPAGPTLSFTGLYDPCLSLRLRDRAVGNDVDADDKLLVMVTGANQGGKSTFLRSVGLAQLMMQCGMWVAAQSFRSDVCVGIYTHYKREEDVSMTSGKLDEELKRMSAIADLIRPSSLLLCNESFASTNEREGSEIARGILRALLEAKVKVVFVTHLFDLAQGMYRQQLSDALFLRAERQSDGTRSFHLTVGEPLSTSFGQDLYRRLFQAA